MRPLPEDFEPTAEEQKLLNLYETVRTYERNTARLKEEAARAKLEARQALYNEAQSNRKGKKHRKKPATAGGNDEESLDDDEEEMSDDNTFDSDVDDEELRHRKKELKLTQLREEVEEKKEQQANAENHDDHIRQAYLTTNETDDVTLIRKTRDYDGPPQVSLIDNLKTATTPPHDFSSRLELKPIYGKVLLPDNPQSVEDYRWEPPQEVEGPNDGAFLAQLSDFDITRCQSDGNNTLAVKFTAPEQSKRFSINIASPDHNDFESILFHFNPRQRERGGQLVVNDKQEGTWGSALAVPLSEMPLMFGKESVTLIIQINQEGFDIFVEGKHCARLEHRTELPSHKCDLVLQFPSSDDRGKPEDWTVYKVDNVLVSLRFVLTFQGVVGEQTDDGYRRTGFRPWRQFVQRNTSPQDLHFKFAQTFKTSRSRLAPCRIGACLPFLRW